MVESKLCNISIKYGRQRVAREENIRSAICLITDDLVVYAPRSFKTKKNSDMLCIDIFECSELAICKRDSEGKLTFFNATILDTVKIKGEEVEKIIEISMVR